jgi:hypothetical protein
MKTIPPIGGEIVDSALTEVPPSANGSGVGGKRFVQPFDYALLTEALQAQPIVSAWPEVGAISLRGSLSLEKRNR